MCLLIPPARRVGGRYDFAFVNCALPQGDRLWAGLVVGDYDFAFLKCEVCVANPKIAVPNLNLACQPNPQHESCRPSRTRVYYIYYIMNCVI